MIQPLGVADDLLRGYSRSAFADSATWAAIRQNRPLTERDCWPANDESGKADRFQESPFFGEFCRPRGLRHLAVAPLQSPLFVGYPGAWHLYRDEAGGPFTPAELQQFSRLAKAWDQTVEKNRQSRHGRSDDSVAFRTLPVRQFILDGKLKPQFDADAFENLDFRLREQILKLARAAVGRGHNKVVTHRRLMCPDSFGDMWTFHAVAYPRFPALGEGPFVFFCHQPDGGDWRALRAADVQADEELARFVPAIQYMCEQFHRGPTLNQIAEIVHISPFHFHRRFTEVFGITPKHFMLECQVNAAKMHLAAGDKDLVEIARSCGFAHQSHFTSRFKQAAGLTPTGWRRFVDEARIAQRG
jgi:AraC-like DNA-binding protein